MKLVFVDTSAWIALGSSSDQYHDPAKAFFEVLSAERAKLVTSDYVLAETYTGLSARLNKQMLESFHAWISAAIGKGRLILEKVEPAVFEQAWKTLLRYYEHGPSFTDCTSVVIARRIKADCVFAFDHHFPIMGIDAQPYAPPRKQRESGSRKG